MRIETDQRNFGGSWRSLRAARSDRHDLADREGPTRTMADQGGVTEDSRRNGPHCGDLPTVVGEIWRTNVRTPAQHYRHPDPCMCDCSLRRLGRWLQLFVMIRCWRRLQPGFRSRTAVLRRHRWWTRFRQADGCRARRCLCRLRDYVRPVT